MLPEYQPSIIHLFGRIHGRQHFTVCGLIIGIGVETGSFVEPRRGPGDACCVYCVRYAEGRHGHPDRI